MKFLVLFFGHAKDCSKCGPAVLHAIGHNRGGFDLHACCGLGVAILDRLAPPPSFEPPTVTPIGNVRDLLERVDVCGRDDE